MKLTIAEIARETGAEYSGTDAIIEAVSTDTRDLTDGCLFVALKGENFDGHKFIQNALDSGASHAVSMKKNDPASDRILYVKDTRDALMAIAKLHRKTLAAKVVAVTGSVGKTTTKEMIACVANAAFRTVKTEKNLNNEIGLSKTILSLDNACEAAVLEMGSDGPGQISKLSQTALPDIGVVTSVGVSHIEAFGTREGILTEKLSIRDGMTRGSDLILCGDNDMLKLVDLPEFHVIRYGIDGEDCAVRAVNIHEYPEHTEFEILFGSEHFNAQIPCLGRHNVLNALAAFCVGICLKIPPDISVDALKNYRPAGMRQNIVVHNSYTVVEDCYNANPDSMRAALQTLGNLKCEGRRIAVLSDMLELGELSKAAHVDAGKFAKECGIDYLLCTGELSRGYVEGATSAGLETAYLLENHDLLFEKLKSIIKPGDAVWFKASRGMKLEQVIEKLYSLQ